MIQIKEMYLPEYQHGIRNAIESKITTNNNNLEINEICNLKEIYGLPALIAHFSLVIHGEKKEKFFNTFILKSLI